MASLTPQGRCPSREVGQVIEGLLPGYTVAYARGGRVGHPLLWDTHGELVRDERGMPFTLPASPSNHRWINVTKSRLRRAGLL